MSDAAVRLERPTPGVALVVLDRPAAANALSLALFAELSAVLDEIAADDAVRAWVLTGAERPDGRPWFSAGADMKEPASGTPTGRPAVDPAAIVERIAALAKPSIAAIRGVCTTGALELAMACHLRLAADDARLSDWHLRATGLGIGQWGAAVRLSRLVGVATATELLLTGREVDGIEAQRIGLVNHAVPDADVVPEALALAESIAALPRRGVRTTLQFLSLQRDMPTHEALRWAQRMPDLVGLELRPFRDAAERFARRERRAEEPRP
jgi:enoyl-CoA hydratase